VTPGRGGRVGRGDRGGRSGSLEPHSYYDEPAYYTSLYKRRVADVAYYVSLAQEIGGCALEYGVGNGRIALPIARHGVPVTGVDRHPAMLADLRQRLEHEAPGVRRRVSIVQGDMRSADVKKRFPLVLCTFNTALHLLVRQDVEHFLARVREHMRPRGLFVMDLSTPSLVDLGRSPTRAYRTPSFRHPSRGIRVQAREYFDYDASAQVLQVRSEFTPVAGGAGWVVPLAHRQFFPQEWEGLVHYNGFRVVGVKGDFLRGPLTGESDVMVWHARLRSGFGAGATRGAS